MTQESQPCPCVCWIWSKHWSASSAREASRKGLRKRQDLSCTCVSVERQSSVGLRDNSTKAHRQALALRPLSNSSPYNRKHILALALTSRDSASIWRTLWTQQPLCYASCLLSCQLGSQHLHILQLLLLSVGLGFAVTLSHRPASPNALLKGLLFHTSPSVLPPIHLMDTSSSASYPRSCCMKSPSPATVMKVTLLWLQELYSKVTCCLKPATEGRWVSDINMIGLSWKQEILLVIKIHGSCHFYRNSKRNPGWQRWDIRAKEYWLRAKTQDFWLTIISIFGKKWLLFLKLHLHIDLQYIKAWIILILLYCINIYFIWAV